MKYNIIFKKSETLEFLYSKLIFHPKKKNPILPNDYENCPELQHNMLLGITSILHITQHRYVLRF